MKERRMATPHRTRVNPAHYRRSQEKDRLSACITVAFLTGILLGVTITLGWLDLTGG